MGYRKVGDRVSIRSGNSQSKPTPYLKKNIGFIAEGMSLSRVVAVDMGCGNGRNSELLKRTGFERVFSYDMLDDYGEKLLLGHDRTPLDNGCADLILSNYVLMFLSEEELKFFVKEVKRLAKPGCKIVVELMAIKNSNAPTDSKMLSLQAKIVSMLGWDVVKSSKGRFIANSCPKT